MLKEWNLQLVNYVDLMPEVAMTSFNVYDCRYFVGQIVIDVKK